ncbi:MAG TPA: tetratricopeptide repeat protein [bacterium]|nr:tetratricopeptide repeat protein [bacterium]
MKRNILLIFISFLAGAIISSYITSRIHHHLLYCQSLAINAMANEEIKKGNPDGAICLLYQAIGRFPESINYGYLADIYFGRKQYDLAESYYKIALKASSKSALSHSVKNHAEIQLQRIKDLRTGKSKD